METSRKERSDLRCKEDIGKPQQRFGSRQGVEWCCPASGANLREVGAGVFVGWRTSAAHSMDSSVQKGSAVKESRACAEASLDPRHAGTVTPCALNAGRGVFSELTGSKPAFFRR